MSAATAYECRLCGGPLVETETVDYYRHPTQVLVAVPIAWDICPHCDQACREPRCPQCKKANRRYIPGGWG